MPDAQPSDTVVRYGPRKIGEKAFKEQQAAKVRSSRGATVYGNRKMQDSPAEQDDQEPAAEVETDSTDGEREAEADGQDDQENPFRPAGDEDGSGYTTIDELEAALADDPELFDLAIEAEFDRSDGVRKGAARVLLETELEREDGPREEVVARLEDHV